MSRTIRNFLRRVEAQDLVEYTLLLAFIALLGISFFIGASGSVQGIWGAGNSTLAAANTTASGTSSSSPDPAGGGSGGGDHGGGDHGGGDHGDHDGR